MGWGARKKKRMSSAEIREMEHRRLESLADYFGVDISEVRNVERVFHNGQHWTIECITERRIDGVWVREYDGPDVHFSALTPEARAKLAGKDSRKADKDDR